MTATLHHEPFGRTLRGEPVERWELRLPSGASVAVLTRGATLQQVRVPDASGEAGDVVVGLSDVAAYEAASGYPGAVVGRVANRIAGGRFSVDGTAHTVPANNGVNALHGGPEGFDQRVWTATEVSEDGVPGVRMSLHSNDGDMGFPGSLDASVTYSLREEDGVVTLRLDYLATADAPTPVNLTNHAYFALDGAGPVEDHVVRLAASRYLPVDANLIPTGELAAVAGTPFDFTTPTRIGERLRDADDQLLTAGGYDHCMVLDEPGSLRPVATVSGPRSGRSLEVRTDLPGLQFYTGNFLDGAWRTLEGRPVRQGDALCLETQLLPDAVNQPLLGDSVLRPGSEFTTTTEYAFSVSPA
jgi:aldose 1-epimerase